MFHKLKSKNSDSSSVRSGGSIVSCSPPPSREVRYDGLKLDMVQIFQTQKFPRIFCFSHKASCIAYPCRSLITLSRVKVLREKRESTALFHKTRWTASPVQRARKAREDSGRRPKRGSQRKLLLRTAALNQCQPDLPAEFVFPKKRH